MKTLKENLDIIIICAIELLIGIVFFTDPIQFTSTVFMGLGIVLLIAGVGGVIRYFTTPPVMAALGQELARGLIALLVGGVLVIRNEWVLALFPLFTQIYGVVILLTGMFKLQRGVDLLRLKQRFWGLPVISALLAILLGAIVLADPFESTIVLWRVAAVTLMAEAVLDVVMLIFTVRNRGSCGQSVE